MDPAPTAYYVALSGLLFAIGMIGVVGMLLDLMFAQLQKVVTYVE